jgi:hypothetical protein
VISGAAQAEDVNMACIIGHLVFAQAAGRACGLPLDAQSEARYRALREAVEARDPDRPKLRDANAEIEATINEHANDSRLCPMARAYQRGLAEFTADDNYKALMRRLEEPDAFQGGCR